MAYAYNALRHNVGKSLHIRHPQEGLSLAQIRIPGDNHILRRHLTIGSPHHGWRGVLDLLESFCGDS